MGAQECMFEYCLYKRDEHYDDCEALEVECKKEKLGTCVKTATAVDFRDNQESKFMKVHKKHNKRPGWGQVYNYGNMHNELESNGNLGQCNMRPLLRCHRRRRLLNFSPSMNP